MAVAQPRVAVAERGDLALVPYYTVRGQWVTGIHIVNTSDSTQVVKFRFRRATDGMDALDFNVVMSPRDVYAGFLSDDQNGDLRAYCRAQLPGARVRYAERTDGSPGDGKQEPFRTRLTRIQPIALYRDGRAR